MTDAQCRHLAVFLERVDEGLAALSGTMAVPARALGLLRSARDDVSPEVARAAELVADARAAIDRLARSLGLAGMTVSRHHRFQALLMSMIVILEDAGSRGLRGFGPVDDSVRRSVDPELERIRILLVRIRAMLGDAVPPLSREEQGA